MKFPSWIQEALAAGPNAKRAVTSATITISSSTARFAGSFVTAIILGRLLTPDEYGVVGMVMPLMAIAGMLSDGGVSNHTLQAKSLSENDLNLTFWLGAALSVAIFLVMLAIAPLTAHLYDDSRLTLVTIAVATSLILAIFNTQHNALVKRCFKHKYLAIAEIVGALSGMAAGISLALAGAGYWALVAVPIARHIGHSIIIWVLTRWVPGLPTWDASKVKELLSFGGLIILSTALLMGAKHLDKVMLGVAYTAVEVGFYAMAFNLMVIPLQQVLSPAGGAVVPYFSQLKENPDAFARAVTKVSRNLGLVVAPLMAFAAASSNPMIAVALGEKWLPSAEIFAFLACAGIASAITMPLNWAMIASGNPGKLAKWSSYIVGPVVLSYAAGLYWGPVGVAAGYFVFSVGSVLATPIYCSRFINIDTRDYLAASARVYGLAILVGVIQLLADHYLLDQLALSAITHLGAKGVIFALTLLAAYPLFLRSVLLDLKAIMRSSKKA